MTENPLFVQSLASRYWQWPVKVKNLLSKVLKWDWPTTKHSPTNRKDDQPGTTSRKCKLLLWLPLYISLTRAAFISAFPGTVAANTAAKGQFIEEALHLWSGSTSMFLHARSSLTRCCSPERWWILEGNAGPCAHRSTEIPPHSGYRPTLCPLRNKRDHVTTTSIGAAVWKRETVRAGGYRGMYSHPHTLLCRPPGCWDCGRW